MGEVHQIYEEPNFNNTVTKPEQVTTKPIYVSKKVAAEMFSVSKSTIYKWLAEAEKSGEWPTLSVRPSATITLIHLDTLEKFIVSKNKRFL
ncbi:helix-turn-helix transcriptional regulator [Salinicoccus sp. CNSTN-B1]